MFRNTLYRNKCQLNDLVRKIREFLKCQDHRNRNLVCYFWKALRFGWVSNSAHLLEQDDDSGKCFVKSSAKYILSKSNLLGVRAFANCNKISLWCTGEPLKNLSQSSLRNSFPLFLTGERTKWGVRWISEQPCCTGFFLLFVVASRGPIFTLPQLLILFEIALQSSSIPDTLASLCFSACFPLDTFIKNARAWRPKAPGTLLLEWGLNVAQRRPALLISHAISPFLTVNCPIPAHSLRPFRLSDRMENE